MTNFNQIALELARSRQEELIAESARSRRVSIGRPSIRQSIGRRDHRVRRAGRGGNATGAGAVPLRAAPALPEEILS